MNTNQFLKSFTQLQNFNQSADMSVQNYHKLIKMKKLLVDTQIKMFNRIKLFQKASQKVLKKREYEMKVFEKLQIIKKDPIFSRTKFRPRTRESAKRSLSRQYQKRHNPSKQNILKPQLTHQRQIGLDNVQSPKKIHQRQSVLDDIQSPKKILAQQINQNRMKNAKIIKEDKERNKIIIEQRKKRQLTRKLQSANLIRRQRQNAKLIKQQVQKEKHEDFKKLIQEKYEREKSEFLKLQIHLQQLQQKQKQALINWKKTIES